MRKDNTKNERSRTWAFIVYPDSAPADWQAKLTELGVPWSCSPLHDKDTNPDGTQKKPHWHIVVSFEGMKSFSQMTELANILKAARPMICHSVKGAVRYFCHLDNPEKAQYDLSGITSGCGFDVADALKPSTTDLKLRLKRVSSFIRDNCITEFADLVEWSLENDDEMFDVCSSQTIFVKSLIASYRHRAEGRNTSGSSPVPAKAGATCESTPPAGGAKGDNRGV